MQLTLTSTGTSCNLIPNEPLGVIISKNIIIKLYFFYYNFPKKFIDNITDIEGLFMINLHTELKELFCEVSPYEFYRAIFP